MKKIKLLLVIIFFINIKLAYSQYMFGERSFLGNSHYAKNHNPAIIPEYKYHINFLPLTKITSGIAIPFTLGTFVVEEDNKKILDLEKFNDRVDDLDGIKTLLSSTINIYDVGIRNLTSNNYYNFGLNLRTEIFANLAEDFTKFIPLIGGGLTGEPRVFDLANTFLHKRDYFEFYFGFSKQLENNWSFGGRVKFLLGNAYSASSEGSKIEQKEDYSIVITSDGQIKSPIRNYDDAMIPFYSMRYSYGFGSAFDFGATYKLKILDKNLLLGASVTDLGFINVPNGVYLRRNKTEAEYTGEEINNLSNIDIELKDYFSIYSHIIESAYDTLTASYTSLIFPVVNLSADYEFYKNNHVGINYSNKIVYDIWFQAFNIYYSIHNEVAGFSPYISFLYGTSAILGTSFYVNASGLNIFLSSDNILSFFSSMNRLKSIDLSVGISLVIDHTNKNRKDIEKEKDLEKIN